MDDLLQVPRHRLLLLLLGGTALPVALELLTHLAHARASFLTGGISACVAIALLALLPVRRHLLRSALGLALLPLLTLMQAGNGGADSSYALLMVVAVIWFGLLAPERDVLVMAPLYTACCLLPGLIFGGSAYPRHWAHAATLALVGLTLTGALRATVRETRRTVRRLGRESVLDPMTGLLSRRGWELVGRPALEGAQRAQLPLSLVLFTIHQRRDEHAARAQRDPERDLLRRRFAEDLRATLRGSDVLASLGEDSFAALLSGADVAGVESAITRLRESVAAYGDFRAGFTAARGEDRLEDLEQRARHELAGGQVSAGAAQDDAQTAQAAA